MRAIKNQYNVIKFQEDPVIRKHPILTFLKNLVALKSYNQESEEKTSNQINFVSVERKGLQLLLRITYNSRKKV